MKCVFTTNDKSETIYPLLKVAIRSLKQNTNLIPIVVWSGADNHMLTWLIRIGVQIIKHDLSFKDEIKHFSFDSDKTEDNPLSSMYSYYTDYYNSNYIETDALRFDVPPLFHWDDYILYADCDVLFLKQPHFPVFDEPLGMVKHEPSIFNAGVLLMNIPELIKTHEEFKQFYIDNGYKITTSQWAYNKFYFENTFSLPLEMNWRASWGMNDETQILHFCGPKLHNYAEMLKQVKDPKNNPLTYEPLYYQALKRLNFDGHLERFFEIWDKYAEPEDKILEK